jgi:hypothetical protein
MEACIVTDREAMKMALEALEKDPVWQNAINNAQYFLRQALAQGQTKCPRCGEVNPAEIHTCSPQREQEPVAWITPDGEGFRMRLEPPVNDVPLGWKALYTAPFKREWVGLTDEEIDYIFGLAYADDMELLRTIEAKLKDKNG